MLQQRSDGTVPAALSICHSNYDGSWQGALRVVGAATAWAAVVACAAGQAVVAARAEAGASADAGAPALDEVSLGNTAKGSPWTVPSACGLQSSTFCLKNTKAGNAP